ncbi:LOW QUALITY PROTEIN: pentatricopeptide repeat-containing protein At4g01990, mitochondrial-like [Curcuma longa]|uniref:LOW QUALITY PROTEIN: pentatricopeptide repeat-containing protein At4g01990, mitochondrial-like n=1 Tax=Curcuma longa TaxID=136217 RepID=UPI003D9ECDEA
MILADREDLNPPTSVQNPSSVAAYNHRSSAVKKMITAKRSIRLLLLWSAAATKMRFCAAAAATSLPADPAVAMAVGTKEKKDPTVLYRRLSALGRAPEGSVTRTLDKWVNEGSYVCADQLIRYVKELRRYQRHAHALELMEWMENTKNTKMTHINHAMRLGLIAKVRGIEAAETYFSDLPEPAKNKHTYGALLSSYCSEKNKNADKAISLYNEMKNQNIASNTQVHFNLMSLYMRLGQHEKVLTQYQEMKSDNIVPDTITCCILMNCYASLNDIESVERVIKEAEEDEKIKLRWSAYSTLASIYCSAGLITKAETALKKFEKLIDGRDREPYHFLISLYSRIGNLEEVKRIWKSFRTVFRKPNNLSYLIMMRSLDKLDDINGQQDLYEEWESVCVTFDVWVANVMIGSYLRKNMIQQAQGVWEKASARGAVPDLKTCDMFLDYYLQNNDMDSALMWLETAISRMKRNEWKLSQDQVDTFLKAFEDTKDVKGAERFCQCLRQLGHLDLNAYEKLLRTYLAANATDPTLRQRIEDDKIELNSQTNKLLEMVCGANE